MKIAQLILFLVVQVAFATDTYTFTSKDGRKLFGTVVSATDSNVTITGSNGQQVVVGFDLLTDGDVQWVKKWQADKKIAKDSQTKVAAEAAGKAINALSAVTQLMAPITFNLGGKVVKASIVDINGSTITMMTAEGKKLKIRPNDLSPSERQTFAAHLKKFMDRAK
jgi:hypothetical protein